MASDLDRKMEILGTILDGNDDKESALYEVLYAIMKRIKALDKADAHAKQAKQVIRETNHSTTDLDEKVAYILAEVRGWKHEDGVKSKPIYDEALPEIKQAFIDAGYVKPVKLTREGAYKATNDPVYIAPILKTGQEWYARFEKEMDNIGAGSIFDNHDDVDRALDCAKKASVWQNLRL